MTHPLILSASSAFVSVVLVWAVEARFDRPFLDAVRVLFS